MYVNGGDYFCNYAAWNTAYQPGRLVKWQYYENCIHTVSNDVSWSPTPTRTPFSQRRPPEKYRPRPLPQLVNFPSHSTPYNSCSRNACCPDISAVDLPGKSGDDAALLQSPVVSLSTANFSLQKALPWLRQLVPAAQRAGPSSVPGQCMWK